MLVRQSFRFEISSRSQDETWVEKFYRQYFVFVVPFIDTFLALFLKNWPYSLLERYFSADLKIIQNKVIELWNFET